ncbi:MAG: FHA domain-containing protein [candidate division KSB1 bacterium]|nr:FHA domain-containing protein [candidate division KSB1 bacterium]MDZ7367350.1 FHA domain-containing protein [candidate division KSB1 bacterium]MDZ7405231.1 FHA domain-containing protein [candidate division KSB1 bacterium]
MPILQITKDGVLLQEFEFQAERVTIGREPENDIRLGDLTVSRRHGQLKREAGGRYFIENLKSRNGIRLNGHPISQPMALTDGDQLKIGVYQLFFLDPDEITGLRQRHLDSTAGRALLEVFGAMPSPPEALPAAAQPTNIKSVEEENAPSSTASRRGQALEIGVLINEANNAIFALDRDLVVLGNVGQVDIRVPGPERARATIARRGGYFYLCSETPAPSVSVNGQAVMNVRLLYNDRIEIGGRRFIFREI